MNDIFTISDGQAVLTDPVKYHFVALEYEGATYAANQDRVARIDVSLPTNTNEFALSFSFGSDPHSQTDAQDWDARLLIAQINGNNVLNVFADYTPNQNVTKTLAGPISKYQGASFTVTTRMDGTTGQMTMELSNFDPAGADEFFQLAACQSCLAFGEKVGIVLQADTAVKWDNFGNDCSEREYLVVVLGFGFHIPTGHI